MDKNLIRQIEEISLNALPALKTVFYDGWVLRFADGYTRRANSVNPIYESTVESVEKIEYCEELFEESGIQLNFKMTEQATPGGLDKELDAFGYRREAGCYLQVAGTKDVEPDIKAEMLGLPDSGWADTYTFIYPKYTQYRNLIKTLAGLIVPQKVFMLIKENGRTAAVGYAVVEDGYVGLYDIAVVESARRKGFGRQIVKNLMKFGRENGADKAYLQVLTANDPALKLYESLGFKTGYEYWYRCK
jgi:GNAT superfamily N-acetyltransferase